MGIKKNFMYNAAYQILLIILPLITTPYISRVIGVQGIGIYSYTYSIANYFVMFAMLGINNYGNRSVAKARENREELNYTFSSILLFHFIVSIIAILGYAVFILSTVNKENSFIFILQFFFVISSFFDINWFFFGMEQFKLTVVRNTFIKVLSVFLIFLFVKSKDDLWLYTLILVFSNLVSQLALWPFLLNMFHLLKYQSRMYFIILNLVVYCLFRLLQ